MAWLVYYNEEIDEEERERRWNTLDRDIADYGIDFANGLADIPSPKSWCHHGDLEDTPVTDEEWESAFNNFPKALEAIKRVPEMHLERRRLMAPLFWRQQKEAWRQDFEKEFTIFLKKKEKLGGDMQDTFFDIRTLREKITRMEKKSALRREELMGQVDRIKRHLDTAIKHLPCKLCAGGMVDRAQHERVDPEYAKMARKLRS
jgi:hypothetical protein